ncbi:hypothetical protein [Pacificispira sp.]|uniref:hypothetical protein n=1 Tax=Pacificispira sp. TaxID=2888761 RepID=UPI003B51CCCE
MPFNLSGSGDGFQLGGLRHVFRLGVLLMFAAVLLTVPWQSILYIVSQLVFQRSGLVGRLTGVLARNLLDEPASPRSLDQVLRIGRVLWRSVRRSCGWLAR